MKKLLGLLMVVLVSLVFFSCGSSDAEILSFDLDGATLVGTATIDSEAKTVTATVEPVDLSTVTPSATVSTGATYTIADLEDGEGVVCTVAAENSTEVEWTVTVTVAPGIAFTYGTTDVVLMEGMVDSTNDTQNAKYGDGVPLGCYIDNTSTMYYALEDELDAAGTASGTPETGICYFTVLGKTTGDMADLLTFFAYSPSTTSSPVILISMDYENDVTLNISEYGAVGEYITGTFSCTDAVYKEDDTVGDDVEITNGFFKVERLADDSLQT